MQENERVGKGDGRRMNLDGSLSFDFSFTCGEDSCCRVTVTRIGYSLYCLYYNHTIHTRTC